MENYQKLYTMLFNSITHALQQLERQNFGNAKRILKLAQRETEDLFLTEAPDDAFLQEEAEA